MGIIAIIEFFNLEKFPEIVEIAYNIIYNR